MNKVILPRMAQDGFETEINFCLEKTLHEIWLEMEPMCLKNQPDSVYRWLRENLKETWTANKALMIECV